MNLPDWAWQGGVSEHATCWWYYAGTLRVPARGAGRLIFVVAGDRPAEPGRTVIDARVLCAGQRAGLGRRVARLAGWVTACGMGVGEVVTEVGSAMSGCRGKLGRLRADPAAARTVAGHRVRLARFGVERLRAALAARNRQVLFLDRAEAGDDLAGDMTEVLTSFCARLCGRRGARNRALRAVSGAGSVGSTGV